MLRSFVVRVAEFDTDMSYCQVFSYRLILILRIVSAIFEYDPTTSWLLDVDHSHNHKPQNAWYQNSNLAPLENVGMLGVFLETGIHVSWRQAV